MKETETKTPLCEYPRPQMVRDSYHCLNGRWALKFLSDGEEAKEYTIFVPYSPESAFSGVGRTLQPHETMCYSRHVRFPEDIDFSKERLLIHFGAVDYRALVHVDGSLVFEHVGGYLPFQVEVFKREFDLDVMVQDPGDSKEISRGKQSSEPGGIWYPKTSGIWQTVWMEKVPRTYMTDFKLIPDLEGFSIEVHANTDESVPVRISIPEAALEKGFSTDAPFRVDIENPKLWSPEHPYLYHFTLTLGDVPSNQDSVKGYVGLRTFGVGLDCNGNKVLKLNGQPYFHHGLLDQGYYEGGYYTPKSDDDFIGDIQLAKSMGFNALRKHIKVEPLRWYYHCDRLGMLVWQDMVSGGGKYRFGTISLPLVFGSHLKDDRYDLFSRTDRHEREMWETEAYDTVRNLFNVVSVAMWVPFNEGWGQFDSARIVKRIMDMDGSRTIDHASGWQDQGIGEFRSLHVYFKPYRFRRDRKGRCVILTEFGGYGYDTNTTGKRGFVYKKCRSKEELTKAIVELYDRQILPAKAKGLAASIYTQLSDVEQETNGLVTYDRSEVKVLPSRILEMSKRLLG